jgi:hypothetical protein
MSDLGCEFPLSCPAEGCDPRYAGGVPLFDAYGLFAVLHPKPGLVRGHAFLLLAGILLLFCGAFRRELFAQAMLRTRYQPMGGYRTDFFEPDGP